MLGIFNLALLAVACLAQAQRKPPLTLNSALLPGEFITSPDGRTTLSLEQGRLVLYKDSAEVFVVCPFLKMFRLELTSTGNLELYASANTANPTLYWQSFTADAGVTSFNVTNDGNARLFSGADYAGWSFWLPAVTTEQRLTRNMPLLSPDFTKYLVLTSYSLTFFAKGQYQWKPIVKGSGNQLLSSLTLTADGNVVVEDTEGDVVWTTNTSNLGGVTLVTTNSGNVELLTAEEKVVWKWRKYT